MSSSPLTKPQMESSPYWIRGHYRSGKGSDHASRKGPCDISSETARGQAAKAGFLLWRQRRLLLLSFRLFLFQLLLLFYKGIAAGERLLANFHLLFGCEHSEHLLNFHPPVPVEHGLFLVRVQLFISFYGVGAHPGSFADLVDLGFLFIGVSQASKIVFWLGLSLGSNPGTGGARSSLHRSRRGAPGGRTARSTLLAGQPRCRAQKKKCNCHGHAFRNAVIHSHLT